MDNSGRFHSHIDREGEDKKGRTAFLKKNTYDHGLWERNLTNTEMNPQHSCVLLNRI